MAAIEKVRGPYWQADKQRWCLRWTEDGTGRTFTHRERAQVAARRAELTNEGNTTSKVKLGRLGPFDGTAPWFKRAFAAALSASTRAVESGDNDALNRLRKHVGNLRDAAVAWVPYSGLDVLEAEIEKLVQYHEHTGHMIEREGVHSFGPVTTTLAAGLHTTGGPLDALSASVVADKDN